MSSPLGKAPPKVPFSNDQLRALKEREAKLASSKVVTPPSVRVASVPKRQRDANLSRRPSRSDAPVAPRVQPQDAYLAALVGEYRARRPGEKKGRQHGADSDAAPGHDPHQHPSQDGRGLAGDGSSSRGNNAHADGQAEHAASAQPNEPLTAAAEVRTPTSRHAERAAGMQRILDPEETRREQAIAGEAARATFIDHANQIGSVVRQKWTVIEAGDVFADFVIKAASALKEARALGSVREDDEYDIIRFQRNLELAAFDLAELTQSSLQGLQEVYAQEELDAHGAAVAAELQNRAYAAQVHKLVDVILARPTPVPREALRALRALARVETPPLGGAIPTPADVALQAIGSLPADKLSALARALDAVPMQQLQTTLSSLASASAKRGDEDTHDDIVAVQYELEGLRHVVGEVLAFHGEEPLAPLKTGAWSGRMEADLLTEFQHKPDVAGRGGEREVATRAVLPAHASGKGWRARVAAKLQTLKEKGDAAGQKLDAFLVRKGASLWNRMHNNVGFQLNNLSDPLRNPAVIANAMDALPDALYEINDQPESVRADVSRVADAVLEDITGESPAGPVKNRPIDSTRELFRKSVAVQLSQMPTERLWGLVVSVDKAAALDRATLIGLRSSRRAKPLLDPSEDRATRMPRHERAMTGMTDRQKANYRKAHRKDFEDRRDLLADSFHLHILQEQIALALKSPQRKPADMTRAVRDLQDAVAGERDDRRVEAYRTLSIWLQRGMLTDDAAKMVLKSCSAHDLQQLSQDGTLGSDLRALATRLLPGREAFEKSTEKAFGDKIAGIENALRAGDRETLVRSIKEASTIVSRAQIAGVLSADGAEPLKASLRRVTHKQLNGMFAQSDESEVQAMQAALEVMDSLDWDLQYDLKARLVEIGRAKAAQAAPDAPVVGRLKARGAHLTSEVAGATAELLARVDAYVRAGAMAPEANPGLRVGVAQALRDEFDGALGAARRILSDASDRAGALSVLVESLGRTLLVGRTGKEAAARRVEALLRHLDPADLQRMGEAYPARAGAEPTGAQLVSYIARIVSHARTMNLKEAVDALPAQVAAGASTDVGRNLVAIVRQVASMDEIRKQSLVDLQTEAEVGEQVTRLRERAIALTASAGFDASSLKENDDVIALRRALAQLGVPRVAATEWPASYDAPTGHKDIFSEPDEKLAMDARDAHLQRRREFMAFAQNNLVAAEPKFLMELDALLRQKMISRSAAADFANAYLNLPPQAADALNFSDALVKNMRALVEKFMNEPGTVVSAEEVRALLAPAFAEATNLLVQNNTAKRFTEYVASGKQANLHTDAVTQRQIEDDAFAMRIQDAVRGSLGAPVLEASAQPIGESIHAYLNRASNPGDRALRREVLVRTLVAEVRAATLADAPADPAGLYVALTQVLEELPAEDRAAIAAAHPVEQGQLATGARLVGHVARLIPVAEEALRVGAEFRELVVYRGPKGEAAPVHQVAAKLVELVEQWKTLDKLRREAAEVPAFVATALDLKVPKLLATQWLTDNRDKIGRLTPDNPLYQAREALDITLPLVFNAAGQMASPRKSPPKVSPGKKRAPDYGRIGVAPKKP